jgi:hypothetical protein
VSIKSLEVLSLLDGSGNVATYSTAEQLLHLADFAKTSKWSGFEMFYG